MRPSEFETEKSHKTPQSGSKVAETGPCDSVAAIDSAESMKKRGPPVGHAVPWRARGHNPVIREDGGAAGGPQITSLGGGRVPHRVLAGVGGGPGAPRRSLGRGGNTLGRRVRWSVGMAPGASRWVTVGAGIYIYIYIYLYKYLRVFVYYWLAIVKIHIFEILN